MIEIEEFNRLKKRSDELRVKVERSKGVIEQQLKELKEKFKCETFEEGEALLKTLEKEKEELEQKFKEEKKNFLIEWGDKLG